MQVSQVWHRDGVDIEATEQTLQVWWVQQRDSGYGATMVSMVQIQWVWHENSVDRAGTEQTQQVWCRYDGYGSGTVYMAQVRWVQHRTVQI